MRFFAIFAFFYFQEVPTWRTGLAFVLIITAVFLVQPSLARRGETIVSNSTNR